MEKYAINLQGIDKTYNKKKNPVTALSDLNLQVCSHDMIAVMGPSGSGKSTLLNILEFIETKDNGKYILNGKDTECCSNKEKAEIRNSVFGFVVQDFALIENYTVAQNVAIPLSYSKGKIKKSEKKDKILSVLEKLGLQDKYSAVAYDLSGGQRQRVAIARALINDPAIILADEPTGELDTCTTIQIINIFKRLHELGKTVILTTHDSAVAKMCEKIITMRDGKLYMLN